MKKRILSVLLCVAMVATLAAGCGSKSKTDSSGEEKLLVWVPPLDDDTTKSWTPLLKDFEKENNCKVQLEIIPWESYEEKYSTALNSGDGPDIGYMYAEMFPSYISSGTVSDMSKYLTEEDYKEYTYLDRGKMMDGAYGFPIVTGVPFVLYYNQDILDSLGEKAPETWEDFERICKAATKDTNGDGKIDQYGYATGMNQGEMSSLYLLNSYYYSALWQAGGDIYNTDLKSVRFNDHAGLKAVEYLKGLKPYMPENMLSLSAQDAFSTIFGQGQSAFGVTRSSQTQDTEFKKSYPDLNWNYVTSLKGENYGTFGAVDSLTLMSACKNKELAVKLMKYIVGTDFMTEYHKIAPGAPMTAEEPYQGDEKLQRIVTEDVDKYRALQVGPCGSEILDNLASELQAVFEDKKEPQQALDDSAKYANGLLDEYWADHKE